MSIKQEVQTEGKQIDKDEEGFLVKGIDMISVSVNIPKRLKVQFALLEEQLKQKSLTRLSLTCTKSEDWPYQICLTKVRQDDTLLFLGIDIPRLFPFTCPLIKMEQEGMNQAQKLINNRLTRSWHPSIFLPEIIEMTINEIANAEKQNTIAESIKDGNVYSKDEMKELHFQQIPYHEAKYPEFQENLNGLWVHEVEFGWILFGVEDRAIKFIYQPKSKIDDSLLVARFDYVLGAHPGDFRPYNLFFGDTDEGNRYACNLYLIDDELVIEFGLLGGGKLKNILSREECGGTYTFYRMI